MMQHHCWLCLQLPATSSKQNLEELALMLNPGVTGVELWCQHRVEQQGQFLKILLRIMRLLPIGCVPDLLNKQAELVVCPSGLQLRNCAMI